MRKTEYSRRMFLLTLTGAGIAAALPGGIRRVLAMGTKSIPQGMQEVTGDVRINDHPAQKGDTVRTGDTVTTGPEPSRAVFVVGRDAYLMRSGSRMTITGSEADTGTEKTDVLHLLEGRVMSVFGKGPRQVVTPTAVAGIRGTGIYLECTREMTYICTCYGGTDIVASASPGVRRTVATEHHESPFYIYRDRPPDQLIVPAPMINHSDTELILLEKLVGRRPPFVDAGGQMRDRYKNRRY